MYRRPTYRRPMYHIPCHQKIAVGGFQGDLNPMGTDDSDNSPSKVFGLQQLLHGTYTSAASCSAKIQIVSKVP